jgi:hypothetical protein
MYQALTFVGYSVRDDHWFWAFIGACAGLYLFVHGFRLLQRKRLIVNTPSSRIRSASMGPVEINGLAVGPYTLTAPITNQACYYYQTKAWQLKQSGKKNEWKLVAEESLHVPFFLDDNTGRLLVNPQGAEMDIHRDFHEEFDFSMPVNVSAFLQRHGVDAGRKTKVEEYCIKPKNSLFVFGTLGENSGPAVTSTPIPSFQSGPLTLRFNLGGGRERLLDSLSSVPGAKTTAVTTATITRQGNGQPATTRTWVNGKPVSPNDGGPPPELVVQAMQKAGIINPAAWEAMGLVMPGAQPSPATAAANVSEFDLHPRTVLMKGDRNPLFMISWHSQRQIIGSLAWKSAAMIWGGPALTLLCSYFVLQHFGWLR